MKQNPGLHFDSAAIEQLGFYVYALYDPATPRVPFYVGKGKGNRVFAHAYARYADILDEDRRSLKNEIIDEILRQGNTVVHRIITYGFKNEVEVSGEKVAFAIEGALIQLLKQMVPGFEVNAAEHWRKGVVGNLIEGHGQKIEDARDLAIRLNAKPANTDGVRCIAFKINASWNRWKKEGRALADITRQEYWDAVRGDWPVVGHDHNVMLVVGDQIVREVFYVERWKASFGNPKLREMDGAPDDPRAEEFRRRFVGCSVAHLFTNPRDRWLYEPRRPRYAPKNPRGPNNKSKLTALP